MKGEFQGKLVKCVFNDGDRIRSIKGIFHDMDDMFVKIITKHNEFIINKSRISKIVLKEDQNVQANG